MTMEEQLWRVQLPTGEVRAMTLDGLDDAFQAGWIHEGTLVLAPGAMSWAPLADVAGLDAPDAVEQATTPSLSPVAISAPESAYEYPSVATPRPFTSIPIDAADIPDDALKPKRG